VIISIQYINSPMASQYLDISYFLAARTVFILYSSSLLLLIVVSIVSM
jgi:hypothetical protein